jgi:hypothetical protein
LTCSTAGQTTYAEDNLTPSDPADSIQSETTYKSKSIFNSRELAPTCGSASPFSASTNDCAPCVKPCYPACCPCGWSGLYAGAEATFLDPSFSNSQGKVNIIDPTTPATGLIVDSRNNAGSNYLGVAPRVWVGYVCPSGWGVRGGFWTLNNSTFSTSPTTLTNFGGTSSTLFNAYTVDLEVTRQLFFSRGGLALGSFGVRNGGIRHAESISSTGFTPPTYDVASGSVATNSQFYGTGPTGAIQYLYPFYQGGYGNLGLYSAYRGSALFGTQKSSAGATAQVTGAGGNFPIDNEYQAVSALNTMYINELQVGLQWSKLLPRWNNNRAFVRGVFEYQNWTTAYNKGAASAFAGAGSPGTRGTVISVAEARALQSVNFVGFGIGAGCYW